MALNKEILLTLKSLKGIGNKKILKLGNYLKENTVDNIAELIPVMESLKIVKNGSLSKEELMSAQNQASAIIDIHTRAGIGITTYYDEDFPEMLRNTLNEEGKLEPPIVLFYKGDLSVAKLPGLAVIGTRAITDFGEKAGMFLSMEFAKRGICIVSGLAIGCDTVGHLGALNVHGKTIAFLAHGLDSIYPSENKELAQRIVDNGGLLLSEYPIGTEVNRYNLVARDRLQAGMSKASLVIQTGVHGGTMHAANTTLMAHKPLYVVKFQHPEQNGHEKSLGNDLLVKKGAIYISGNDDFEVISQKIKNSTTKNTLFD